MRKILLLVLAVLVLSAPAMAECTPEELEPYLWEEGCYDPGITGSEWGQCYNRANRECMYGGGGDGYWTCYWVGLICIPIYTY